MATLPLLLLELERSDLPRSDLVFVDAVNVVVLVALAVDYVVELALGQHRRRYVRHEWTSLMIVLAQALTLVPALAAFGALRALRAARLFRALAIAGRALALGGAGARSGREVLRRRAAGFAISLAGLTWITSAAAFTADEDVGEGGRIHSFFDALWWSAATITTVGYGDIYPITAVGHIIGGFTMIVGISAFAVVTARVAAFLARPESTGEPAR